MKEHPILFSAPMVRAILDGRKTQTRRVVKPQPPTLEQVRALAGIDYSWIAPSSPRIEHHRPAGPVWAVRDLMGCEPNLRCPYGQPGDRLWVRETFGSVPTVCGGEEIIYAADFSDGSDRAAGVRYKPSIHMPRSASRITLEIIGVRVERLHDISETDANAEGCAPSWLDADDNQTVHAHQMPTYKQGFARLWRDINGASSWDANAWVWVVEFRRIEQEARAA